MIEPKFQATMRLTILNTAKLRSLRENPIPPEQEDLLQESEDVSNSIKHDVLGNRNAILPSDYRQMWEATIRWCAEELLICPPLPDLKDMYDNH